MKTLFAGLIATLVLAHQSVLAHDITQGNLKIVHPWAKETRPGQTAGSVYLIKVINNGKQDDKLIGINSKVAKTNEVHEMSMEGSTMKMTRVAGIPIPAGKSTTINPSATHHLMLLDLHKPLVKGQSFPVELVFEKAGKVTVTVDVEGEDFGKKPKEEKPAAHDHGTTHKH